VPVAADRIEQLERMIREARETPLLGGAMVDRLDLQGLLVELRADLFEARRELPDGRWVVKGPDTATAADELDDLVENANNAPFTGKARIDRRRALELTQRMRAGVHAEAIVDTAPEAPWDAKPILRLIDEVDAALRRAKPIPLTDQVRVDSDELYEILDRMRDTLPRVVHGAPYDQRARAGDLLVPIDELDDLIHNAQPVPLTPQVRIERQAAATIVQTMRAAFSQGTGAAPTN